MRIQSAKWWPILGIAAGISWLVAGGCSRGEVELRNTVTAYTKVLSEALSKPDAKLVTFFAAPQERARIDSYILFLLKDKKVIVSTLQKLDFKGVEVDKDKTTATVTTHEEWSYYYVDEKSRQPISKEEWIAYNNVYHLIQEQGHWVVEKIDMNETQAANQQPAKGSPAIPPKAGQF